MESKCGEGVDSFDDVVFNTRRAPADEARDVQFLLLILTDFFSFADQRHEGKTVRYLTETVRQV